MSPPLHRVTLWACEECLKNNSKGRECHTFGCDLNVHDSDPQLWDRANVAVEDFTWEGCPTCHIEDSGGWAVRYNVDVSKCATCKGTGLVRVRKRDPSERPVAAPPQRCLCMARCGWWDCPVHFPAKKKK